ncbi:Sec-independent protein translocase subunit TatB [Pasteurellaceae bacterium HPA106]|uniref:Sec-independent protein translocase protein TatB n=1 Tax=Spirabiliibacterium pneumoniae TaxID=221400 RepID=UPI001AAD8DC8|nr:Sec-independent protein translocase protein TatB [Spirabiliibacterium pneumoniae]MBE2895774.1 Sec-independent protein translocase subunit TatB [Spirabiliibacterium pneumoniae]
MFDIGFSELLLIFVVGLVVLGPQRLPVAIRTVVSWIRTVRGLAANVQNELSQELKLHELQESIKKAEQLNLSELSPDLAQNIEDLKASAHTMQQQLQKEQNSINNAINDRVKSVEESERVAHDDHAEAVEADSEQAQIEEDSQGEGNVPWHYHGMDIPAESDELNAPPPEPKPTTPAKE